MDGPDRARDFSGFLGSRIFSMSSPKTFVQDNQLGELTSRANVVVGHDNYQRSIVWQVVAVNLSNVVLFLWPLRPLGYAS